MLCAQVSYSHQVMELRENKNFEPRDLIPGRKQKPDTREIVLIAGREILGKYCLLYACVVGMKLGLCVFFTNFGGDNF